LSQGRGSYHKHTLITQKCLVTLASEGFFQVGSKSGEISFYPLETKKTTLFAKSLTRKCQILKSRGLSPKIFRA